MTIIQRIYDTMEKKGLKPIELARLLDINKSVVSTWKQREKAPPSEYLVQICEFLEVSIQYILTGTDGGDSLELDEKELIRMYRSLPPYDRKDSFDIIKMKLDRVEQKNDSSSWDEGSGATA